MKGFKSVRRIVLLKLKLLQADGHLIILFVIEDYSVFFELGSRSGNYGHEGNLTTQ